ncbi:MAG: hypothetical protein ACSHXB_14195 [Sulfitobacter sp.]
MPDTIKQTEAIPASYPSVTPWWDESDNLSEDRPTDPDQIWQRIEAYTAHRFTPRAVVWIVEGEGDWEAPLTPATVSVVEYWDAGAWVTSTVVASPYGGLCLPDDGPWRITASGGGGGLPAAVSEAFKRLHEYTRGINFEFRGEAAIYGGETERVRDWTGRAIQLSGAADLLRPYRRAN